MGDRCQATIDSNMFCRHALQDHDDHSPRANTLFKSLATGEICVFCPITAVFETIHIVHKLYGADRSATSDYWSTVLAYPGLITDNPVAIRSALSFWVANPGLDFADCYHLALTEHMGLTRIYTFDKKMDRYPGVERV